MSSQRAQIILRKEAAAQRQLDAAIRMTLHEEDELAIHTVAAAAYGILRDLKKHRGQKELSDRLGVGIFAVASDLASGRINEIPPEIAQSNELSNIITDVCLAIKSGKNLLEPP